MSESKLDKIESKIDAVQEKISSIDKTLAAQHEVLVDHTRRSLANEQAVNKLSDKLQPVLTHVAIMQLCGKILLVVAGSEVALYFLRKVFNA